MFKNNKFYLISYLNSLIHGLLTAKKMFETYIIGKSANYNCRTGEPIEQFLEYCSRKIQEKEIQKKE